MSIESRLNAFYNESADVAGHIWKGASDIFKDTVGKSSLIAELRAFGNSIITNGVNANDYKKIPKDQLDAHMDYHEKQLLKLTTIPLETLAVPDIFNIEGKQYNDKIIPVTAYRIAYNMFQAMQVLNNRQKRNIVIEIGGGFGLGAYIMTNNLPNTCYIIIDIQTTSLLSAYFLMTLGKRVCLAGEFDKWDNSLTDLYDVIILPQEYMIKFDDDFADVIINTASLTEMPGETINYYIPQINRVGKNFYSDNHNLINGPYLYSCLDKLLPDHRCIYERETPIIYTHGLWPMHVFYERLYSKGTYI